MDGWMGGLAGGWLKLTYYTMTMLTSFHNRAARVYEVYETKPLHIPPNQLVVGALT